MPPVAPNSLTEQKPGEQQQQSEQGHEGGDQQQKPVRPEGLGESLNGYWSDDKGVDFAKLSEDHAALSTLKAEADSRAAQVPGDVNEYEVGLPDGFEVPKGFELTAIENHPALAEAREFAKANGLTKDQFKGMVALHAKMQMAEHAQLEAAAKAEFAKLGTKGQAIIDSLVTELKAKLGADADALLPMLFTAKQVAAVRKLLDLAKGDTSKLNGGGREAEKPQTISEEEWGRLSGSQKIDYARSHAAASKAS